jgi:hypothetical protein
MDRDEFQILPSRQWLAGFEIRPDPLDPKFCHLASGWQDLKFVPIHRTPLSSPLPAEPVRVLQP